MSDEPKAEEKVSVQGEIIKAMERLKERNTALEGRVKVMEAEIAGMQERTKNLENAFETAFKNAEANVEKFMTMLAEGEGEGNSESEEASAEG